MNTENLQPLSPEKAKEMYLRERQGEVSDRTLQAHHYRLVHFIRWSEENGTENMNNLTGRDIHEFRLWRKDDGDLNAVSLQTQLQTLRVFIRFCESIDGVREGLSDKVRMPTVDSTEERSEAMLSPERATEILEYLSRFEYASRFHVIMELLWHTGLRMGALHALDVDDFYYEDAYLAVNHRPETETALKNGTEGERYVGLSLNVCETVKDWIEQTRPSVTDEHGREPLIATRYGRIAKSSIRAIVYNVSRPCYYADECPHGREIETCEATEQSHHSRCPTGVSPHAIRRGSITHHLSEDVPEKVVSDRMNVSPDVIDKHYDQRSEEVKVEQQREFIEEI